MRGKAAAGVFFWALALTGGAVGMAFQDSQTAQAATEPSGEELACEELPAPSDVEAGEASAPSEDPRC